MFKLPKPEAVNWIELDANEWELIRRKPVMTVQEFAYCSIGAMIPPRKWDGSIIEEITKSVKAKTDLELGIDWRNHETNIHIEAAELMDDFIRTVSERHDVLRNNAISGDLGVSYPNPDAPSDPYYKIKDMIEFARNNGWELPPQLSNEITQKVELVTDTSQKSDAEPWLIQNQNGAATKVEAKPVTASNNSKVYWRVVLKNNIKTFDAASKNGKATVREVIKSFQALNDVKIPCHKNADTLVWIDDMGSRQTAAKKTISNAMSEARKQQ